MLYFQNAPACVVTPFLEHAAQNTAERSSYSGLKWSGLSWKQELQQAPNAAQNYYRILFGKFDLKLLRLKNTIYLIVYSLNTIARWSANLFQDLNLCLYLSA